MADPLEGSGSVIESGRLDPEIVEVLEGRRRWAVVQGDSLLKLRELPDACVDGLVADSPYSSGGQFRGDRAQSTASKYVNSSQDEHAPDFTGDTRDQRSFTAWTAIWMAEALRVSRPGAPACAFTDWRQLPATTDGFQAGGWLWRGVFVWDKTEGVRPQKGRFRPQCEFVVWGSNGPMPIERGVPVLPGLVRCIPTAHQDKHHIAGKPVDALTEIVSIVEPDGIVLDPFCGSASTGVAALRTGRRYIGLELLPHFVALSRRRLAAEEAGLSLREADAGQGALFGGAT